jgi:hypothetical protein
MLQAQQALQALRLPDLPLPTEIQGRKFSLWGSFILIGCGRSWAM